MGVAWSEDTQSQMGTSVVFVSPREDDKSITLGPLAERRLCGHEKMVTPDLSRTVSKAASLSTV